MTDAVGADPVELDVRDRGRQVIDVESIDQLREQGRMAWVAAEYGWASAPDEVLQALSSDGFAQCKLEMTTSRSDNRPAGGVWQGVNQRTGSVASAIWVTRARWPRAIVFITIDGEALTGPSPVSADRDPYQESGGEA